MNSRKHVFSFSFIFFIFAAAPLSSGQESNDLVPLPVELNFQTVAAYPHDRQAFTQGLVFEDGFLYESTGQYGESTLRRVEPETGKVLRQVSLPSKYFGEGIAIVGDRIYMLTWQEGFCFVFDKTTFRLVEQFRYTGEGWGLAFDGEHLIMSDGSATLRFFDPKTFKQQKKISITDKETGTKKSMSIKNLNELEYIRGEIWANVWQTPRIVRIDPKTGTVLGWLDCTGFVPEQYVGRAYQDQVLNGIACDAKRNRIFLTGKNWPILYELEIVEPKK